MVSSELLKKSGFSEETLELAIDTAGNSSFGKTGFPSPILNYRVITEKYNQSIEESYFWTLEFLKNHQGYPEIVKINDIFTATEHSSFFGNAQQRLGLQQDKVSQYLATIGKMVKEIFQLVRELRILDERLSYYIDSESNSKSRESAEITLKGIWIDLVEQGSKNPASVYGMARELQFTTLPDLFFAMNPRHVGEVDKAVERLDFNRKVKEVLKRKLRTYLEWKKRTFQEHKNRRMFTLKYLRQHVDVIKMYMNWVKPYLRNVQRLQLANATKSPNLIAAFEGSLVEIEFLAKKKPTTPASGRWGREMKQNQHVNSVLLIHMLYRTSPQMNYSSEYQRGPIHVGHTEMTIRGYAWTDEEIQKYLDMKGQEDFELLKSIDESVKAAIESLGDELERYMKEAGETINIAKKKPQQTMSDPFVSIFKGFGDLFGSFKGTSKKKGLDAFKVKKERDVAKGVTKGSCFQVYKYYKKKDKLLAW